MKRGPSGIPILILVCVAAGAALSCSRSETTQTKGTTNQIRTVRTIVVASRPMERIVTTTGSLAAHEAATLSVKIGGRLKNLPVDIGTVVKKGDLIAQVEPRDYELRMQQSAAALAQARAVVGLPLDGDRDQFEPEKTSAVKQAKAVLDEASKNRERVQSLSKEGIAPASEVDTVEAAYKVALNRYEAALEETRNRQAILAQRRAEFELASQQLSDTSMRAPFDGAVQMRLANLGEFLAAGSPVVNLVKTDPLRLRLEVPERDSLAVRLDQEVRLTVDGDTNIYFGRISRVSPAIDEAARMLRVEADVPTSGSLRPGLFTRTQIITRDDDEGLSVPVTSLITFAGLEKVVVVSDGKALEKTVVTGRRGPDWVEIVSGLKPGERVVLEPGNLRTGEAVTVTESAALQTRLTPRPSEVE